MGQQDQRPEPVKYRIRDVVFDPEREELVIYSRVKLSRPENRILLLLCQHAGHALSVERILEAEVSQRPPSAGDAEAVDRHIRHLLEKAREMPGAPQPIQTVAGMGYTVEQADQIDERGLRRGLLE